MDTLENLVRTYESSRLVLTDSFLILTYYMVLQLSEFLRLGKKLKKRKNLSVAYEIIYSFRIIFVLEMRISDFKNTPQ